MWLRPDLLAKKTILLTYPECYCIGQEEREEEGRKEDEDKSKIKERKRDFWLQGVKIQKCKENTSGNRESAP